MCMYSFFFGALPGWLSVFTCNLHFYDYCQSMRFCVCACVYNNFMFLVYLWLRDYYYYNFDSIMFTFCMWVYPSTKFTTISFFCLFFFFFLCKHQVYNHFMFLVCLAEGLCLHYVCQIWVLRNWLSVLPFVFYYICWLW